MYCGKFEAVMYCLHATFCVGLVYLDEQASIWPSKTRSDSENGKKQTGAFFAATTSICVVALELLRLVARDVPTIAYT